MNHLEAMLANPEAIRDSFAIIAYGRSGSALLGSLFDGHPGVLTATSCVLANFGLDVAGVSDALERGALSVEEMEAFVANAFPGLFVETPAYTRLGAGRDEPSGVPREKFLRHFRAVMPRFSRLSAQALFIGIHAALAGASDRVLDTPAPSICWALHNPHPEHRKPAHAIFPGMRWVSIVRRPEKALDSDLKFNLYENPRPPLHAMLNGQLAMFMLSDRILPGVAPADCAAVRFEDLHENPEGTMRALAGWLGLAWDVALLRSSIDGKTYWWESPGGCYTDFDPKRGRDRRTRVVKGWDKVVLRVALEHVYSAWGYGRPSPWARWIYPAVSRLPLTVHLLALLHPMGRKWSTFLEQDRVARGLLRAAKDTREEDKDVPRLIRPLAAGGGAPRADRR